MKIISRRFSFEDIDTRVEWINNPSIHSTMYFDLPATIENTRKWFERIKSNDTRVDFTFVSETGGLLAMGGFTGISEEHKHGEFYVMVNPAMHGQGIGKRVSEWMYNYGFSVKNLNKIYLYTNDDNVSAYNIYEKAGFVLEGIMREHKWKEGKFINRRFYGLLHSEWDTVSWKKVLDDV